MPSLNNLDEIDRQLGKDLALLCADESFLQLQNELSVFNPFRVLKVERYELRHTTTLAWLLDPRQTHGMGDAFLKSFLKQLPHCAGDHADERDTRRAEVLSELIFDRQTGFAAPIGDETGAAMKPGADRLDVLIEGKTVSGTRHWGVAIEAKIDSNEGEGQLGRYDKWLDRMPCRNCLVKLYLTVQPVARRSGSHWVNIQWGNEVRTALEEAMASAEESGKPLQQRVREFLDDYRMLLRGLSDNEDDDFSHRVRAWANRPRAAPTLRALKARVAEKRIVRSWDAEAWVAIYWTHKALLDTCMERVRGTDSAFIWESVIKDMVANDDWHIITPPDSKGARVDFVPAAWLGIRDMRTACGRWNLCYHAEFRNSAQNRDVEIKLFFPRTGDRDKQYALLNKLRALPQTHAATPYLQASAKHLEKFMGRKAESLKLYTVSANWTRRGDGTYAFEDQQAQGKRAKRGKDGGHAFSDFPLAVAAHAKALADVAGS